VENGKKKAKLLGWDKDSLTELQKRQAVTTIILIRRVFKTREYTEQLSLSLPNAQSAPQHRFASPQPAPSLHTKYDGTGY